MRVTNTVVLCRRRPPLPQLLMAPPTLRHQLSNARYPQRHSSHGIGPSRCVFSPGFVLLCSRAAPLLLVPHFAQLRNISVDSPRVEDVVDIAQSHCFFAVHSKLFDSLMGTIEQCANSPDFYMSKLPFLRLVNPDAHSKLTEAFKVWLDTTPRDRFLKDDGKRFEAYDAVSKYSHLTSSMSFLDSSMKAQLNEKMQHDRETCSDLAKLLPPHQIEMLLPTSCPALSQMSAKRAAVAARFFDAFQGDAVIMLPIPIIAFEALFFYENKIVLLPHNHPSYSAEQQADARTVYGMSKCSREQYATACQRMKELHMRSDRVNPISRDSIFEKTLSTGVLDPLHSPLDTIVKLLALEDLPGTLFKESSDNPLEWSVYNLYLKFFAPIAHELFRGGVLVELDVGDM